MGAVPIAKGCRVALAPVQQATQQVLIELRLKCACDTWVAWEEEEEQVTGEVAVAVSLQGELWTVLAG